MSPPASLPQRLYFIRHGATAWSLTGQHTGRTDIPLLAEGEQQVLALAPWLHGIAFSRVLTSPLQRARRTCELTGLGAAAEIDPVLREWDYGDYEGRRSVDISRDRPGWNVFQDGCPGGESPPQVAARADRLIAGLATAEGNIAVFSHGQFGCVLAARWIALAPAQGQHFVLDPATLSILGGRPGHPGIRAIALWNASPAPFTAPLRASQ